MIRESSERCDFRNDTGFAGRMETRMRRLTTHESRAHESLPLWPYQHTLAMQNGTSLVLRQFDSGAAPRAAVIIPSAMGVAQNFYARFAEWLSSQGFLVVTFDYRGVGLSAPRSLRGYDVSIRDWATQDCASVIDFVKVRLPEAPLYWIGHSLGGQLLGLIPNRDKIDRVMTIATGSGYWRENAWRTKRFVLWMWFVAVPLATRIAGYFPGQALAEGWRSASRRHRAMASLVPEPRVRRQRRGRGCARSLRLGAYAHVGRLIHGRRDDVGERYSIAARALHGSAD